VLINGGNLCNVFFTTTGGAVNLGVNSTFNGTIIAQGGAISAGNNATVNGRLLACVGAINLDDNTIGNPCTPCPTIDAPTADVTQQPTCTVATGTIVVTAPTGTGIEYSIGGTYQSGGTFNNVAAGTYQVTTKNSAGCISLATQVVVNAQPATPDAPTASVTAQPTCTVATGTIVVTAPTGTGIEYSIGGAYQSGGTFNNVAAGTYQVTVKNSAGCISPATQVVVNAQPATPAAPTASVTAQPTCATATGTITVTAPTGTGVTYSIGGTYQSGGTFNNVAAGTYQVTVKNSAGCISPATQVVVNAQPATPAAPTASVTAQPTCATATGTITVTAPTGTGVTYSIGGTYQSGGTFNNVAAGTYQVTAKNSAGCISPATQVVVNARPATPAAPTASVTSQPTCTVATGTIVVTAPTGTGIEYSIGGAYQSGGTFNNVAAGTYQVTAKNSAGCISSATQVVVNARPTNCGTYCSYTQGFYSNANGLQKLQSGLLSTPIIIGSTSGNYITIPANTSTVKSAIRLNSVMPGGSTPTILLLPKGNCNIMNSCFNAYLSGGRINNVLLSQTIALSLNIRLNGGILASFAIQSSYITTSNGGCVKLNSNVVNYLTASGTKTATVQDLLKLANDVLGGIKKAGVGGVPSLSDINSAVTAFNEVFDECRTFTGYKTSCTSAKPAEFVESAEKVSAISVKVGPNPYNDKVRFVIQSPISGQGSLDVYSLLGQKLQNVYRGHVDAGRSQNIEFNVPASMRTHMIYIFDIGGRRVSGRIIKQ
jgi:uncharacterized cupin superfamily protein